VINERELVETLVDKLEENITDVATELFPDQPLNYNMRHPNGAILVAGGSVTMSDPDLTQQYGSVRFDLFILSRSLNRQGVGIYDLSMRARNVMESFYYGMTRIWCVYKDVPVYSEDRWERKLTFAMPNIHRIGEDYDQLSR
jgi:hypothetical protein